MEDFNSQQVQDAVFQILDKMPDIELAREVCYSSCNETKFIYQIYLNSHLERKQSVSNLIDKDQELHGSLLEREL
jgi:hypothetical protein